jgi:alcohol dehydrogenase YqhD (iron-dependent ADH family)
MQNFTFYNPVKVIFGAGELKQLGTEAKALGKRALVVSYREHAFMLGVLEDACARLKEQGVEAVPFYEAVANPTLSEVEAGTRLARAEQVDLVIGIGGGSVMDTAKLVAAGVHYTGDLWGMIYSRHDRCATVPPETALPLLMVPTLPATSSEMNCGAVVTNPQTHEKSYLFHPCIYPKVSILDPALTCSLPAYQTACGGADAISHVLEVYFNGDPDTPMQDRLMEGIVASLMEHVPAVLKNPSDVRLRSHIMWESCLAWNGWILPGTAASTPMHMIAHGLSARFGITHGATLAMIMPAWMRHTCGQNLSRYNQFAKRVLGLSPEDFAPADAAREAINRFQNFLSAIGVQTCMAKCGVQESDIDMLVEDVVRVYFNADGLLTARVPMTREDVRAVLELAL